VTIAVAISCAAAAAAISVASLAAISIVLLSVSNALVIGSAGIQNQEQTKRICGKNTRGLWKNIRTKLLQVP